MEIREHKKKNFMAAFHRHEPLILDSTAMGTFKTCPRKYFYRVVLGFVPKRSRVYIEFGAAFHKFMETLDKMALEKPTAKEDGLFILALATAMQYAEKKMKPEPPGSDYDFLTIERLKLSCMAAFEFWKAERNDGRTKTIAVEQMFNLALPDGERIGGRIDKIVERNGKIIPRDYKTTKQQGKFYERSLEPNDQFSRYIYACSLITGSEIGSRIMSMEVDVLYNSKREGPTITRYQTNRTKSQIEKWLLEHIFWNKLLNSCREEDIWPMNEKSCYMCEYHNVCKCPTESGQMSTLKSYFTIQPWDFNTI